MMTLNNIYVTNKNILLDSIYLLLILGRNIGSIGSGMTTDNIFTEYIHRQKSHVWCPVSTCRSLENNWSFGKLDKTVSAS